MQMPFWQQRAVQEYLGKRYRAAWKNRNFLRHYSMGLQNLQDSFSRLNRSLVAVSEAAFFIQADGLMHSSLLDEQSEVAPDTVSG